MYIQCSTVKRKGKDGRNRKLVESYRDPQTGKPRNRTVQKLEKLPILERSRLILKHGGQKYLDAQEWKVLIDAGDFTQPDLSTCIGDSFRGAGNWVLLRYFKNTGLESLLRQHLGTKSGNILRDMVTLQILDPDSKLGYVKKRQQTLNYVLDGKPSYKEDTFYQSLDLLEGRFEQIRNDLNKAHPPSGRLLLYDLSNSYFCGTKAELGGYGDSKEKRHDRYIVSYGLVTCADNLPLDIKVWKGGTADVKTVAGTFADWKQKYHSSSAIWVADRSMSDEGTLEKVQDMGLSYITGLPAASQLALLGQIHEGCPELFDETLTEFTQENRRYILCRHNQKGYRREMQNYRNLRKVYEALKKIQSSPQNYSKEKLYHRAMKVLEKHNQTHCWKLSFDAYQNDKGKERYKLNFKLNRQQFRAQNIIGHYYLLQTNLPAKELTSHEAKEYYKSLIKAERCFRLAKSDLEIRPIRHRKAARIRAHIYLNFLAIWLVKYIEKSWRGKGIHHEAPAKLREWDQRMMLHEIIDKNNKQIIELQWNQGTIAQEALDEMRIFGELGQGLPHL
ncbi:MAG: IS1634 family transposase [Cyclobacteriaceae bacterium]|nr:IS1634 family transposase [Cyclobacteriaceae bacterium]